ncbi:amino acid adenylation domain-containing protein [Hahella aquimaris]|uniref:non-ribosomal peptide synthetase n=1 Tax=Hahella sp. HNIBRBA332 TaxID=3015983 RepID=UPI00273C764D|nr:non-ribosomal peptide synthetase [Hahella sp. HNIBRBA332]WLQ16387.1 amino acid adenylation domain-containing protein [Hahella sp. HNIBRBA332]
MFTKSLLESNAGHLDPTAQSSGAMPDCCVHDLFERQAALTPNAIALSFGAQTLTYAALNRRANRLAHTLRRRYGEELAVVGVCLDRGVDAIVAVIAALKAGAAYAPVDTGYPVARQAYILNDSNVSVVISRGEILRSLPGAFAFIDMDAEDFSGDDVADSEAENPSRTCTPDDLAYLIYTSGSTGAPKGVCMPHKALVNLLVWQIREQGDYAGKKTLQFSPLSFDVSFQEIFATLASGGELVLMASELRLDPVALLSLIASQQVQRIFLPYVALNSLALAAVAEDRYPHSLIDVVTAGEQLVVTGAIRQFFTALPTCRLHNHYGPSESHVVTAYTLEGSAQAWPALPSVGRAIDHVDIYLLDENNRVVSDETPGELCIGGPQLAYGYHQRLQETVARFVDIDVDGGGPKRLYRTGDLARRRSDGLLDILGRIDFQVKIRGYRVELGEVEALLMGHPAVRDAVVVARGDAPDSKYLAAFVIVSEPALQRQTRDGVLESIRRYMTDKAPDYMRPAAMAIMERFPLSASGKIDRKGFPDISPEWGEAGDATPPQTELEQLLAEVWSELLNVGDVGRSAHFFNLGGHSLLIVKMMLALRRRGFIVDAHTLYQYPVLSDLALQLRKFDPSAAGYSPASLAEQATTPWEGLSESERAIVAAAVPGGLDNVQDICPLGPLQQGMLYHALTNPAGDPYVLWQVTRFRDAALLHAYLDALRNTLTRHAAFRVGIVYEGLTQPLQVVCKTAELTVEALTEETESEDIMAALKRRCDTGAQRFDIAKAPLQRCYYAYDRAHDQWVLLHLLHHLAVDHATVEKMQQEIEAQLLSQPLAPVSPVSFRQVRRNLDANADPVERKAFFDAMLQDFEPGPAPLDAEAYLTGEDRVTEAWRSLPPALSQQIRQQAKAHGVSVAAIFHLAWAKVIGCLSGSDDVVFGTVLLGRMFSGEDTENAMGQFINTLPVRLRLGAAPLRERLWNVQDMLMQLVKHEQASLAQAQKSALNLGEAPLFTTLLNYRHSEVRNVPSADPFQAANPSQVEGVSYSGIMERTTYPLSVNVDDFADDFVVNVQVEQAHDPERICDFIEAALQRIAHALETAPETRISRLNPLPEQEMDLIVRRWNQTAADFPRQTCVHEMIEAQAASTPDAIAVEFADEALTYAQLNRRANQLARYLREDAGAGPDALVGVCLERSLDMVVSLLAVLKAGAAYTPLDPHYPRERLEYMLHDAAPKAVLSHDDVPAHVKALLDAYAEESGARLLDLNQASAWRDKEGGDLSREETAVNASHLAYVIYTSGSTGRPKGVMNEHRGVVNRLVWMQRFYGLTAQDAVLQKTPFSFDVSVWEFFWPLMYGARLVVAKPEGHKDPVYLSELICARRITTLHFVPSMLTPFLDQASAGVSDCLRRVLCSGEALPAHSVRRFRERFDGVGLYNLYGPTEAAIDVSVWDCRQNEATAVIPIGRPIDNIRLYILDVHGQPCPVGVAGELHIAGVGVARGYLNQAALTAEKFVNDPFDSEAGNAMYRTGDLARYLPNGDIEYLGRNDFQVKLRGFRIELGEVEAAISSHASVKECVALVREDTPGDARLVAYVIRAPELAEAGADAHAEALNLALRKHLQGRLPAFMVPSNFVWLQTLPVTSNGKLDRKALPAPSVAPAALTSAQEAPRDGVEARLAHLWRRLLNTDAISRQTHFFEAGGHSLLAVALMAAIQQEFNLSISLSALVAHLDLQSQARLLEAELAQAQNGAAPAPDSARPNAPMTIRALPAQKAIYKAVKLNPADLGSNSFVALEFEAEPDLKQLRNLLQTVFSRHEALGAQFVLENDELFLRPGKRFLFRLEKRQSLGALEADVRDFIRPFTLEDGMNVRGRWVTGAQRPLLLLDFSHACIDGSALAQILDELAAGADRVPAGDGLAQYSGMYYGEGFSALRREHADYWLSQLRDRPPGPEQERSHAMTGVWRIALDADEKAQIDALTAGLKISAPEFFIAAFTLFKSRVEQMPKQLTSMIFHGRDNLAQQTVVAPLMTVLPVAVTATEASQNLLRQVSVAVRDACRHYLFDPEELETRNPALSRQALRPSAFFGYFKKEGFAGEILGVACRQLELPFIADGQGHWSLTCEVAEHACGFEVRLEALSHPAEAGEEDWGALFYSTVQRILNVERKENGSRKS